MSNFKSFFEGKKVTVMGLGLLGRGIGDAEYLAKAGAAEVIVTDLKSEAELAEPFNRLKGFDNIVWRLGGHDEADFVDRDFILVAAGVPVNSQYLAVAREEGVPLYQSAALFAELTKLPIIGVTGTRGKSTVTHMIHHVLDTVTDGDILLGGNIRGVSNLQLLNQVHEDSLAVMELDSWQLQGWGWSKISPQIAVFTNFMEDHLDYYLKSGGTKEEAMAEYFSDKANIFRYQEESGVLITVPEVFERAKQLSGVTLGQEVVLADESLLPEDMLLSMPGKHNRLNAALAMSALEATSLSKEEIYHGLATFPGVPGRLEYLGEKHDLRIFNDNNSTTPQATVQGLKAVGNSDEKNVILIVGGTDKNIDLSALVKTIPAYCKHVILYSGTGTEKLKALLPPAVQSEEFEKIEDCVEAAFKVGLPGDVLLFSPAFSSFGKYYKNEYDRNDQFVEAVQKQ
jgi:UDP-N-acetylmuramoylalanine--D-glutamate ligase